MNGNGRKMKFIHIQLHASRSFVCRFSLAGARHVRSNETRGFTALRSGAPLFDDSPPEHNEVNRGTCVCDSFVCRAPFFSGNISIELRFIIICARYTNSFDFPALVVGRRSRRGAMSMCSVRYAPTRTH